MALGPTGVFSIVQNVPPELWPKVQIWPVLVIEVSDQRLVNAGLKLLSEVEVGLGTILICGARLVSGRVCALRRNLDSPRPFDWILEFEATDGLAGDVNSFLEALDVDEREISWVSPVFSFARFEVMRQDDNGVCASVREFRFQATAQHSVRSFEATGHKQMYWVQPLNN